MKSRTKQLLLFWFRMALVLGGIVAVAMFIHDAGPEHVWATIVYAAPLLPVVILLEAAWVAWDAVAVRLLYRSAGKKIPLSAHIRAALIAYPFLGLLPAGRAGAEAARAASLAKYVRGGRAAAVATQAQAAGLLGNFGISAILIALCIPEFGIDHWISIGILVNGILAFVGGVVLFLGIRGLKIGGILGKYFEKLRHGGTTFDRHVKLSPVFPPGAILCSVAGRATQSVQYIFYTAAVGGALGLFPGLMSQAVHIIGALIGDLVPSQLGVTDGIYKASTNAVAPIFQMEPGKQTEAAILTIATLGRIAQLFWSVVGLLVPFVWPAPEGPQLARPVTKMMSMKDAATSVLLHIESADDVRPTPEESASLDIDRHPPASRSQARSGDDPPPSTPAETASDSEDSRAENRDS